MFGLMRDQWVVTKGVREIVIMAEEDGMLMPPKREEMVKAILELSRDLGIATKGISAHEQVMTVSMAMNVVGDPSHGVAALQKPWLVGDDPEIIYWPR